MNIPDQQVPGNTHNLHNVTFFRDTILTVVTYTPSDVDTWISEIKQLHYRRLRHLIVGLDVEWRPNVPGNQENRVATLQLCVGHRCLIFQILHAPSVPWSLRDFLINPSYTFAGVGIDGDVQKLKKDYNLDVRNTADLRWLALRKYGQSVNVGLKGLTQRVLGKELIKNKAVTMSRWDNRFLDPMQVQYACIDAYVSFEMGRILIPRPVL